MIFGHGFPSAAITGVYVNVSTVAGMLSLARPGVWSMEMQAPGGGGGGKNQSYTSSAEAGSPGQSIAGEYHLDAENYTYSIGPPGNGGLSGSGFDFGKPGSIGGTAAVLGKNSSVSVLAVGGTGGRPAGYGPGTPNYNPVPSENGGYGGSFGTSWNRANGDNGGGGYILLKRLS